MATMRARAASILSTTPLRNLLSSRSEPATTTLSDPPTISHGAGLPTRDENPPPTSSTAQTLTPSPRERVDIEPTPHRVIRAIPTWARSQDRDDDGEEDAASQLLPQLPPEAQVAQHNNSPTQKLKRYLQFPFGRHGKGHEPAPGRLYDHQREWTPPLPSGDFFTQASRWRAFADAFAHPTPLDGDGERVTEEWFLEQGVDYSQPWSAGDEDEKNGGTRLRAVWWKRFQRATIRSPLVPLVIRLTVWVFSLIALTLGSITWKHYEGQPSGPARHTSPMIAIVVDAVALVYLVYITWDEYTGKPLGLRSARAKMRLIFLDLFFIVFDSANLSLAFAAISDPVDEINGPDLVLADMEQKALAWCPSIGRTGGTVIKTLIIPVENTGIMTSILHRAAFDCVFQTRRDSYKTPQERLHSKEFRRLIAKMATLLAPINSLKVSSYQIAAHGLIPNTSLQRRPMLIYHSAFPSSANASSIESHLSSIGVVDPQWRYTMYNTTHFHSTSHEVLCVSEGKAKLCFGGDQNPDRVETEAVKGDVMIVPAGVGHCLLEDIGGGFEMVGSYPKGDNWDMCYGKKDEQEKIKTIERLPWFQRDPIYGDDGPVLKA